MPFFGPLVGQRFQTTVFVVEVHGQRALAAVLLHAIPRHVRRHVGDGRKAGQHGRAADHAFTFDGEPVGVQKERALYMRLLFFCHRLPPLFLTVRLIGRTLCYTDL